MNILQVVNHRQRPIGRTQSSDLPDSRQAVADSYAFSRSSRRLFRTRFGQTLAFATKHRSRVLDCLVVHLLAKEEALCAKAIVNEESGHDD